jgi:hypothetical protein
MSPTLSPTELRASGNQQASYAKRVRAEEFRAHYEPRKSKSPECETPRCYGDDAALNAMASALNGVGSEPEVAATVQVKDCWLAVETVYGD